MWEANNMVMGKTTADRTTDMREADCRQMGKMTADGTTDVWEVDYSNN